MAAQESQWAARSALPNACEKLATCVIGPHVCAIGAALSTTPPHPAVGTVWALPAARPTPLPISVGITDARYDPATAGQGFFITVFPEIEIVFLSWFTYDAERPQPEVQAVVGDPGHRWLTAQGPFANGVAVLDVVMTRGGAFDSPTPAVRTDSHYGTITIEWPDCESATLAYELTVPDLQGVIELQRVASDRLPLCESLSGN